MRKIRKEKKEKEVKGSRKKMKKYFLKTSSALTSTEKK